MSSWKTPRLAQSAAKGQREEEELLTLGCCLVPSGVLPAPRREAAQG